MDRGTLSRVVLRQQLVVLVQDDVKHPARRLDLLVLKCVLVSGQLLELAAQGSISSRSSLIRLPKNTGHPSYL